MSEIKTETKPAGFRKALSDIEKRHELIYGMAINAYNTCLVLEMTNMEEFIDLKFRLRFFEEAALPFYTDDDTDKEAVKLMEAIIDTRDSIRDILGNDWDFRPMHDYLELEYLSDKEKEEYETYVSLLNITNAAGIKDCESLIFSMKDSIYCIENCSHFKDSSSEKKQAFEQLERDSDVLVWKFAEFLIKRISSE